MYIYTYVHACVHCAFHKCIHVRGREDPSYNGSIVHDDIVYERERGSLI